MESFMVALACLGIGLVVYALAIGFKRMFLIDIFLPNALEVPTTRWQEILRQAFDIAPEIEAPGQDSAEGQGALIDRMTVGRSPFTRVQVTRLKSSVYSGKRELRGSLGPVKLWRYETEPRYRLQISPRSPLPAPWIPQLPRWFAHSVEALAHLEHLGCVLMLLLLPILALLSPYYLLYRLPYGLARWLAWVYLTLTGAQGTMGRAREWVKQMQSRANTSGLPSA